MSDPAQLETVSPATRLLEKRRLMYDKQEQFEKKKEEFKREETNFRDRERDMKANDNELHQKMIKFHSFFEENKQKRNRAKEKILDEKKMIEVKEQEINSKLELLSILQQKAERIQKKTDAMGEYGKYLESVKNNNQDEYTEISDILSRYNTLKQSNVKLEESKRNLENKFDDMKNQTNEYEKIKKTEIMSLNNDVANLQKKFEKMEELKSQLKQDAQDNSSKKLQKIAQLAQILMSINNLYKKCQFRADKPILKFKTEAEDPVNFSLTRERKKFSESQLQVISQYMKSFKDMLEQAQKKEEIKVKLDKLKH